MTFVRTCRLIYVILYILFGVIEGKNILVWWILLILRTLIHFCTHTHTNYLYIMGTILMQMRERIKTIRKISLIVAFGFDFSRKKCAFENVFLQWKQQEETSIHLFWSITSVFGWFDQKYREERARASLAYHRQYSFISITIINVSDESAQSLTQSETRVCLFVCLCTLHRKPDRKMVNARDTRTLVIYVNIVCMVKCCQMNPWKIKRFVCCCCCHRSSPLLIFRLYF